MICNFNRIHPIVNCNDERRINLTQAVKEKIGDNNNRGKQIDQGLNGNKIIMVDEDEISEGTQRWRKRALELANDVESLKQQLCMVELGK